MIRLPGSFTWMAGQLFQFMEIKVQQRGTGSSVLSEFKAGKSPIVTATDVAACGLGMEIKLLKHSSSASHFGRKLLSDLLVVPHLGLLLILLDGLYGIVHHWISSF